MVSSSIFAAAQVCTRTADMPGYVDELVDHGVSHVFLEKPGAPTVDELGRMKDDCAKKGATIWMGFNKNVTAYVTKGREALAKVPGGDFTLVHHNAYKANELGECFERNAEGMLKNMARSRRPGVSISRCRGWSLFRV